jgi:hypothetical protein
VLIPVSALPDAARAAADGDLVGVHLVTGSDGTPAIAGFGFGTRPSPFG